MTNTVMNEEQRGNAKAVAKMVALKLPKGPMARAFHRAHMGSNEEGLLAIHFILSNHEDGRARLAAIF